MNNTTTINSAKATAATEATSVIVTAVPSTPMATPSWGAAGLMQTGSGLIVVIGVIFLLAWLTRRFGLQRNGKGNLLKVVSSATVGKQERVIIVEVADTWLVLGVTAGQINTLHSLPAQTIPELAAATSTSPVQTPTGTSFGAAFAANFAKKLREVTQKNSGKNTATVASSFIKKED